MLLAAVVWSLLYSGAVELMGGGKIKDEVYPLSTKHFREVSVVFQNPTFSKVYQQWRSSSQIVSKNCKDSFQF